MVLRRQGGGDATMRRGQAERARRARRPILLTVDDDPSVSGRSPATCAPLRRDYRIMRAASGEEACRRSGGHPQGRAVAAIWPTTDAADERRGLPGGGDGPGPRPGGQCSPRTPTPTPPSPRQRASKRPYSQTGGRGEKLTGGRRAVPPGSARERRPTRDQGLAIPGPDSYGSATHGPQLVSYRGSTSRAKAPQLLAAAGAEDTRYGGDHTDGRALSSPDGRPGQRVGLPTAGRGVLRRGDVGADGGWERRCTPRRGPAKVIVERPGRVGGQSSRIENSLGFPDGVAGSKLTERARRSAPLRAELSPAGRSRADGHGPGAEVTSTRERDPLPPSCGTGRYGTRGSGAGRPGRPRGFLRVGRHRGGGCAGQHVIIVGGTNSAGRRVFSPDANG